MSNSKGSNNKKKDTTSTKKAQVKRTATVSEQVMAEEKMYTILRIIIAVILVAIIVVLAVKACKKDEKDNEKDKKVTTTTSGVEIKTTTRAVYYNVEPVVYDSEEEQEIVVIEAVEEEKEDLDTTAPIISGFSDNGSYDAVYISAIDDRTKDEDIIILVDDEPYNMGDAYNKNGKHTVRAIDEAGNESEKSFIIAKFVKNKEEFNEALADEENEYIGFENDIDSPDDIVVTRDVKLTAKEDTTLTFGLVVADGKDVTIENVKMDHKNGKRIRLNGKLKVVSSQIESKDNTITIEGDDSELEMIDSDISLDGDESSSPAAIIVSSGAKNTDIKLKKTNINMGPIPSKAISYEGNNDGANLVIDESVITSEDESLTSVGVSLNNQKEANIAILSSQFIGCNPSIDLGANVTDSNVAITDSTLSGEPEVANSDESNIVTTDEEEALEEVPEAEIELLSLDLENEEVSSDNNEEIVIPQEEV